MNKRSANTKKDIEVKASGARDRRKAGLAVLPDLYWYAGILVLFIFSLILRIFVPYKNFFIGDIVRFSSESDAWYHMMLAKTTFLYWQRPWYDPLTNFPNGNDLHFGPFMDWAIAIIAKIVSFGGSNLHTVDVVGAYWPAILGALLILPVYFIGKEIGGRGCGLTAAIFVTLLPGQLFSRTTLGFTDHHSSEVVLSSLTILLFILALKASRNFSFKSLKSGGFSAVKKPLLYSLIAGLSLGLYLSSWSMGILFEGILLLYLFIQGVLDHYRGRQIDYLGFVGAIGFIVAMLILLPIAHGYMGFSIIQYSLFQPTMLFIGAVFALEMAFASRYLRKGSLAVFPAALIAIVAVDLVILYFVLPALVDTLIAGLFTYLVPRTGGAATVAELSPLFQNQGVSSNFPGFIGILSPFYVGLVGLLLLLYKNFTIPSKEQKPKSSFTIKFRKPSLKSESFSDLLVIVWCLVILAITIVANRSAYYYAVNVALLCGYLFSVLYKLAGFRVLESDIARLIKSASTSKPYKAQINLKRASLILAVLAFGIIMLYPSTMVSYSMAKYASTPTGDWVTSITWLGNNTPDPGLGIYHEYERPPTGQSYAYPSTAYGVMSWWDYGHLIETIGARYPNANPFQQGIGSATDGRPGSSPFFLAENESAAEDVLTRLSLNRTPYMNARYIMTDVEMAVGKFHAIAAWSNIPSTIYSGAVFQQQGESTWVPIEIWKEAYYRTMVARLQFYDGSETVPSEGVAVAVTPVEYEGSPLLLMTKQPLISSNQTQLQEYVNESIAEGLNSSIVGRSPASCPVKVEALQHFRLVHESETSVTSNGQKYVKTFENVPGVTITGNADPGTQVVIAIPIVTSQNRTFIYRQTNTTTADGSYTFVVPYSTEGPVEGYTNFDCVPSQPYALMVGQNAYQIRVPEEMIMEGGVITV